ncbi:uncharacterized protein LY79DRAFT_555669 [Colletotrichum navitas]|uniref:Uncharacterized protein n=1 Tax=Colletotrichum navitas TaxID=681940 RepID=A0AAD8V561_9PEZI|nr:uncharacterized protein LY79DRAFT_555669 [Colletotrichum navitas]KAK1590044.1 hypothetical protein LY79DRAFT_555669 [Colletotrichum navitas]
MLMRVFQNTEWRLSAILNGLTFSPRTVHAKRGITVVIGVILTPQLIRRSGARPESLFEAAGIDAMVDRPDMRHKFEDHLMSAGATLMCMAGVRPQVAGVWDEGAERCGCQHTTWLAW